MSGKISNKLPKFRIIICIMLVLIGNSFYDGLSTFIPVKQAEESSLLKAETGEVSSVLNSLVFRSVKGREIKVYIFNITGDPTTLVVGGVHGDEYSGVSLARALLNDLQSRPSDDFKGRIIIIPIVNPDGLVANTRVNAHGIDINRNFPTQDYHYGYFKRSCNPGKEAASEPETKAILEIVSQFKPTLILSFHAEMGCVNFDGPAREIAEKISAQNGLPVRADLGYSTPGSMGTYFGRERNIPVITLELLAKDDQWGRHGKAILELIGVGENNNTSMRLRR